MPKIRGRGRDTKIYLDQTDLYILKRALSSFSDLMILQHRTESDKPPKDQLPKVFLDGMRFDEGEAYEILEAITSLGSFVGSSTVVMERGPGMDDWRD